MIEYFDTHQAAFWFSVGFVLLALEIIALGLSSGVVLFAAIGALLTGALMWAGVLPATWVFGIACFGVTSAVSALLLWKPLLRFQNEDVPERDTSSDLVGHEFRLESDVSRSAPGGIRYSGVDWKVDLDEEVTVDRLTAGTKVIVTSVDAGLFRVRPL